MKKCPDCGQLKSKEDFNKSSSRLDGLQGVCRDCSKRRNNRRYLNDQGRRSKIKIARDRKQGFHRTLLRRFKSFWGCRICGERDWVVLDLHHLDPSKKDMEVSKMVGYGTARLRKEIRKCCVLCSNCHRRVHAGRVELS